VKHFPRTTPFISVRPDFDPQCSRTTSPSAVQSVCGSPRSPDHGLPAVSSTASGTWMSSRPRKTASKPTSASARPKTKSANKPQAPQQHRGRGQAEVPHGGVVVVKTGRRCTRAWIPDPPRRSSIISDYSKTTTSLE
jgi:hypothetical protein